MTAALDRIGSALTTRPATVFFDALTDADQQIAKVDDLELAAMWIPPCTTYAQCTCGSVFEIRRQQLTLHSNAERVAVMGALSGMGIGAGGAVAQVVLDAINAARDRRDQDTVRDWEDNHAYCGDDL